MKHLDLLLLAGQYGKGRGESDRSGKIANFYVGVLGESLREDEAQILEKIPPCYIVGKVYQNSF